MADVAYNQQDISLEDIFVDNKFDAKTVPGFHFMRDGQSYSRLVEDRIVQFDLRTGEEIQVLFDARNADEIPKIEGYSFSADESKILIQTAREKIYRHSSKNRYYVVNGDHLSALHAGPKQRHATFSPDGTKVAFVAQNDLYIRDLVAEKTTQVTRDGRENHVINGAGDWVYEEEFVLVRAFEWSPDSRRIAFVRFNESNVQEFTMMNYRDDLYPEYVTFKYPKVGEKNSTVEVKIYDVGRKRTANVRLGDEVDIYVPRIKWTDDPEQLCVLRMNRKQNALDLLLAEAKNGKTKVLMHEDNKYYIDVHDNLTFLPDGDGFLWTSEQDGYNHLYHYDMRGKIRTQLTSGRDEVTAFYGFDKSRERVYYQKALRDGLDRAVYSTNLKGKKEEDIAVKAGTNDVQFSTTFDYYVLNHSSLHQPPHYAVHDLEGMQIRVLEDNAALADRLRAYDFGDLEFMDTKGADGTRLNGWMMKPYRMNASRSYPLLMFVYGGPGSQMVRNTWNIRFRWYFHQLTEQGYVVACVDNRGTGGRGQEFKKCTYLDLGKLETADQTAAAEQLGRLPYIDKDRIGIFGWSYGGYMSSLCILKSNDVFKSAVAVAPVTNWKWYDTVYTERYMQTEASNKSGYQDNSPVYFADRLRGGYLIVHGLGDDNVHFQHTAEMVNALIRENKPFDTMFYPNRAHAISRNNAKIHLFTKMNDFLFRNL